MKKIFISLAVIVTLMAIALTASITVTDFDKVYKDFVKTTKIDISTVEDVSFEIVKFPFPYLVIKEVKQKGKVKLKDVEIRFSLASLLAFDPKITNLKIGEAKIHLNNDDISFINHDEFISELINKDALSVQAQIGKLRFVESDNEVPFVIENLVFSSSDNLTSFEGIVDTLGVVSGSFKKKDGEVLFDLEVKDKNYLMSVSEVYKDSMLVGGRADIKSSSVSSKLVKLIPDLADVLDKFDSSEEISITFDIEPMKNWMGLKNIVIDSDSLNGTGVINLSKNLQTMSDCKLNFTKIDLDSWVKAKKPDSLSSRLKHGGTNKRFDFTKNKWKIDIFAKDIKLDENNAMSDVSLRAFTKAGKFEIQNFSGAIDGEGGFRLSGAITQNSFRSLFKGKIALNHKDLNDFAEYFGGKDIRTHDPIPFSLSSDIKMSSVDISLSDMLLKTHDTEVMGSISSKFIGNSPRTNANIRFSRMDLDKRNFPAIVNAFDYAMSLISGMKDSDYLNKFIPIRKISTISNIDIAFDQLTLNNKSYENVNFNLDLSPGKVLIEQLYIQEGDDWVDASLTLEAQGIRPVINAVIHSGVVGVDFLSAPGILKLRKKILSNLDLSKIDLIMNFSLKKLHHGEFVIKNVKFQSKNDDNLFDIRKFDADILGGRLQSSGSILLEPYTINFVYALNSASIDDISKLLPAGMLTSGGFLSASGMVSTHGDKLKEQLYNLYTKSNLVTKNITLGSFSIDSLVQALGIPNYNIKNFQEDLKKSLLTGETQISDLKTSIELTKGVVTLPSIVFKTKYTAASGAASLNIYDFNIDSSTIFSFYLAKQKHGRRVTDYAQTKMVVSAKGNLFSPKKEGDTEDLQQALRARVK